MGGDLLMNGNGETVDLADSGVEVKTADPPMGELGSAWTPDSLFESLDGNTFQIRDPSEDDYETMLLQDGKARALEAVLTLPLRWVSHSIEPQDGDKGEAEWLREALTRPANGGGMTTPLELVLAQMTSAIVKRRAFFEKVFDLDKDGKIVYSKLAFRDARTCWLLRSKKDRSFRGFKQRFQQGTESVERTIKPNKAFVYLHDQRRDPQRGASSLDTAYRIFDSKQKIRWLWLKFLETNVVPNATFTTDEANLAERVKAVATLKSGGVVGLKQGETLTAFEASGHADSAFKDAMDWLSAEQSQSVLASFTDLAQQGSGKGSYALSKDQSDFFLRSRQATLVEMGEVLSAWVLPDLIRYNFGGAAVVPLWKFGKLAEGAAEDALKLFERLSGETSPNPNLPREFLDELTVKVAAHLELEPDKIKKAIDARIEGAGTPGEELRGGIEAAAQLVQQAGIGAPA